MTTNRRQTAGSQIAFLAAMLLTVTTTARCVAKEYDGFTEPYKTVNVAAVETGTIKTLEVQEGEFVRKGQVVARLDDEVHQALLAISVESMSAQGQVRSAEAEIKMRRQRLEKLVTLREQGHARQEEVDRAQADLEIAEARLLSAHEQLEIRRLEHNRVNVQLERRAVRAPMDGVVSFMHKSEGEFVAPNDPHVLELVCLDPLMATFNVPSRDVARLKLNQKVRVGLSATDKYVEGQVAMIAPVTDAESSTVRIKVRIPNADGKYRSGEQCTLDLPDSPSRTRRPSRR